MSGSRKPSAGGRRRKPREEPDRPGARGPQEAESLRGRVASLLRATGSPEALAQEIAELAGWLESRFLCLWTLAGKEPIVAATHGVFPERELLDRALAEATASGLAESRAFAWQSFRVWVSPLRERAWSLLAGFDRDRTAFPERHRAHWDELVETLSTGAPLLAERPPEEQDWRLRFRFPEGYVPGDSLAMRRLYEALLTAIGSRFDVLLLGETGTGKELIAQTIHRSGPTAGGPFVALNCAAIPAELLEAQLFGIEARVATGVDPRPGLIQRAEGGTIFLDEIGELPDPLEAKLLRFLQEREILPLGASRARKVEVRVVAASNRELLEEVRTGRFRADLYYRLSTLQFHLPPLRHRREDIPQLALAFSRCVGREHGKEVLGLTRAALEILLEYDWPGNVRELRHAVTRAVLAAPAGAALGPREFGPIAYALAQQKGVPFERSAPPAAPPPSFRSSRALVREAGDGGSLALQIEALERRAILQALAECAGNHSRAARRLGLSRNGLSLKMRRLGLTWEAAGRLGAEDPT